MSRPVAIIRDYGYAICGTLAGALVVAIVAATALVLQ